MRRERTWMAAAGVIALLIGVAVGATQLVPLYAASESEVATIDLVRVTNEYLVKELEEPLKEETAKLQEELDAKLAEIESEAEQKQVFEDYQRKLNQKRDQMVAGILPQLNDTIAGVARERGFDLVLERQSVVYGGVDLTGDVLLALGIKTSETGGSDR